MSLAYLILLVSCKFSNCVLGQSQDYLDLTSDVSGRTSPVEILKWDNLKQPSGMYRIPYYFDESVGNLSKAVIQRAIKALYGQTCIQFDPAEIGDQSIIRFSNSSGCLSFVGRKERGISTIYGCNSLGDVLGAILNALGIRSETLRPDRDTYVLLFPERMLADKVDLISKMSEEEAADYLNFPYDRKSVNHFRPEQYAASDMPTVYSNKTGKPLVENRWALSKGDINRIQAWYNCSGVTGVPRSTDCYHTVDNGIQYRGNVAATESGIDCQRWNARSPQNHQLSPSVLTGSGLGRNYCRNPTMKNRPWCYTTSPSTRWEYCNITTCNTISALLEPTPLTSRRGFWGPWSAYSRCSRTCGSGYMYSVRPCIGADVGSAECPGEYWKYLKCNYKNCSGEYQWKPWQDWSECDTACGNGTHTRVRSCDGLFGQDECVGDSVQVEDCSTGRTCPLYAGGECYKSSNLSGYRGTINVDRNGVPCINWTDTKVRISDHPAADLRENFCRNPDGRRRQLYCFISKRQRSSCNVTQCNRRAHWDLWGEWSSCSVSCGNGTKTRTRRCVFGHYSQKKCVGDVFMTAECNATCRNGTPYIPDDEIQVPVTDIPDRFVDNSSECLDFRNPRAYRGTKRRSKSGYECQEWDALYPWTHNYSSIEIISQAGLSENYCRTPDSGDKTPWCFVKEFFPMKEECSIRACPYSVSFRIYFASLWASFLQNLGILS